jgi:hypothetical protein
MNDKGRYHSVFDEIMGPPKGAFDRSENPSGSIPRLFTANSEA